MLVHEVGVLGSNPGKSDKTSNYKRYVMWDLK
jgi:hypothetical protein